MFNQSRISKSDSRDDKTMDSGIERQSQQLGYTRKTAETLKDNRLAQPRCKMDDQRLKMKVTLIW